MLKSIGIIAVAFALQVGADRALRQAAVAWLDAPTESAATPPGSTPLQLRLLSLGQLTAAADWLWLRALQDPAISHVPRGVRAALFHELDLLTELDPLFFDAYSAGSNLLVIIRDDEEGALALLRKAARVRDETLPSYPPEVRERFWRRAWELPVIEAYIWLFEREDIAKAATRFTEAAAIAGAPEFLHSLAARFARPGGELEVGQRLLNFMMAQSEAVAGEPRSESLRPLLEKRRSLEVIAALRGLNKSWKDFLGSCSKRRSGTRGADVQKCWEGFLSSYNSGSDRDPWGGRLALREADGRIVTTTVYRPVFGLSE